MDKAIDEYQGDEYQSDERSSGPKPLRGEAQGKDNLSKTDEKRMKWNEYMRNYRLKQKKEQTESMINPKHMPLEYNGRKIFCRCDDVRDLLLRYTHVLIALYNLNIESFDDEITELLDANSDNLMKFSKILVRAFESMINESPLSSSGLEL